MRFQNFCEFLAAAHGFAAAESWRFIRFGLDLPALVFDPRPVLRLGERSCDRVSAWLVASSWPSPQKSESWLDPLSQRWRFGRSATPPH
jgi:hypothetical protein